MKILFKNKTKYTREAYDKYLKFHNSKYGINYKFSTIVIILLLSFCIICNLKYSNLFTAILILFALILFCIYRFYYPRKKVSKELKTEKFRKEKEFTFTFYNKYFVISYGKVSEHIRYWKLHKIFETDEFFYLYVNKDHSFLIDKSTFIKGNVTEFFKFIKKKTWFKI